MRRFLMAIALTCVLSGAALAGEMPTCGTEPPAPDTTEETALQAGAPASEDSASPIPTCELSALLMLLDLAF